MSSVTGHRTILFLAANPAETDRLRLDQEFREIDGALKRAAHGAPFRLVSKWAVTPDDLRRGLLDEKPEIVHFSGHGRGELGLLLEALDRRGARDLTSRKASAVGSLVGSDALSDLFGLCSQHVRCVVLNSCSSLRQASAIARQINNVIGMEGSIIDSAAIHFTVGFYDALGSGMDVEKAFDFGCNAIKLGGLTEHAFPVLLKNRTGTAAATFAIECPSHSQMSVTEDEFISILEVRAAKFRSAMEQYKKSMQPSWYSQLFSGEKDPTASIDEFIEECELLHKARILAIRKGAHMTAREVSEKLHDLFYYQAASLIPAPIFKAVEYFRG